MRLPEMPVYPTNIPSELRDLLTIAGRIGKASVTCRSYLWAVLPFATCPGLEPLIHCLGMLFFKPSVRLSTFWFLPSSSMPAPPLSASPHSLPSHNTLDVVSGNKCVLLHTFLFSVRCVPCLQSATPIH